MHWLSRSARLGHGLGALHDAPRVWNARVVAGIACGLCEGAERVGQLAIRGEGIGVNHKSRVLNALSRKGYDRIPLRYMGEPLVTEAFQQRLGVAGYTQLLDRLGDDLRYVQPTYCGPAPRTFPDGSRELVWPDRGWPVPTRYMDVYYSNGYYSEAIYRPFEVIEKPGDLNRFEFPAADWIDYSRVKEQSEGLNQYATVFGTPGILDFINGIAHSRGVERVLLDIGLEDPVYIALMERKFEYHYEMVERTLQAGEGLIDIVQTGEDQGTQEGLLVSPAKFDRLFTPKYRVFSDMVHRCGSVRDLIPRLIDVGLDVLDVVQTSAVRMDIRELAAGFGHDLSFCGTMCVQKLLPEAAVDEIRREVELRLGLFADGGLILGPTHLIQEDTPLENILAMYETAGGLCGD